MNIAVTAASGQLGGAIVRELVRTIGAASVVALARTPENASGLGVEVRPGDYDDRAQLEVSLAGVDAVLLVSGMDAPDDRVQQHRNVIDAARAAGVAKIVYTSIQGAEEGTAFSPVVRSNRQTEADVRDSGLAWAIGRNGIYIEPDVEYIDTYKASGEVANSAGDGKCGYTTRAELAHAYARLVSGSDHDGRTVNLHGEAIAQTRLVALLNATFGTRLTYRPMTDEAFIADRIRGTGTIHRPDHRRIYQGIRNGAYDVPSDFAAVTGRPHQTWEDYFASL